VDENDPSSLGVNYLPADEATIAPFVLARSSICWQVSGIIEACRLILSGTPLDDNPPPPDHARFLTPLHWML
jgi:hypothetical protein